MSRCIYIYDSLSEKKNLGTNKFLDISIAEHALPTSAFNTFNSKFQFTSNTLVIKYIGKKAANYFFFDLDLAIEPVPHEPGSPCLIFLLRLGSLRDKLEAALLLGRTLKSPVICLSSTVMPSST